MAQRTIVQLTDDLDGRAISAGKGETVRFSLDRQDYEIDLGDRNAKALRDALGKYVQAGRRAGGTSRASRGPASRSGGGGQPRDYDPRMVREWAEAQGMKVSQRGRVSADLIAKFQEANG